MVAGSVFDAVQFEVSLRLPQAPPKPSRSSISRFTRCFPSRTFRLTDKSRKYRCLTRRHFVLVMAPEVHTSHVMSEPMTLIPKNSHLVYK